MARSVSIRGPAEDAAAPGEKIVIVMPAYNAARTLESIVASIPEGCYDELLVVDDASTDETAEIARRLPVTLIRHEKNHGYGGNQKTCYRWALEKGATLVIMLHPDSQYDARVIPATIDILRLGICDMVLGSRIRTRREALDGGMPLYKYLANRMLSLIENVLTGQNLGEWHSGFRAYRRQVLERVPFEHNSDDFVFDSQLLLQAVHFGYRVGDLPVPVIYSDKASSISFARSVRYGLMTLVTFGRWLGHRSGLLPSPLFRPPSDVGEGPG